MHNTFFPSGLAGSVNIALVCYTTQLKVKTYSADATGRSHRSNLHVMVQHLVISVQAL